MPKAIAHLPLVAQLAWLSLFFMHSNRRATNTIILFSHASWHRSDRPCPQPIDWYSPQAQERHPISTQVTPRSTMMQNHGRVFPWTSLSSQRAGIQIKSSVLASSQQPYHS